MAYLVKPELNEMYFRRKLHESANTMGGKDKIELFPKEKWEEFYLKNVEADPKERFYRYQYCPDCADFTGELGWIRNEAKRRYELFILIQYERRRDGYGRDGIMNLLKAARQNGIAELYAVVQKNSSAVPFFHAIGMQKKTSEGDHLIFSQFTVNAGKTYLNCK